MDLKAALSKFASAPKADYSKAKDEHLFMIASVYLELMQKSMDEAKLVLAELTKRGEKNV